MHLLKTNTVLSNLQNKVSSRRRYLKLSCLDASTINWPICYSISLQLFHFRLKTLLFNKSYSYPDSSSSPYALPVSTLNTIHHSRLTVCMPNPLDDWI